MYSQEFRPVFLRQRCSPGKLRKLNQSSSACFTASSRPAGRFSPSEPDGGGAGSVRDMEELVQGLCQKSFGFDPSCLNDQLNQKALELTASVDTGLWDSGH